jgi:hypothetical protein
MFLVVRMLGLLFCRAGEFDLRGSSLRGFAKIYKE